MNYKFGDVIPVKFPQSGRQDTKRRPAVVVLDIVWRSGNFGYNKIEETGGNR